MIQCKIEKIVYGGYGLARTNQGVALVADSITDELIEIEIIGKKGGNAIAKPIQILEPSPFRREPPCQYAAYCGGCDWQHIAYEQQLETKRAIFIECLTRLGKLTDLPPIEVYPSPEWRYRMRAQINANREKNILGFFKKNSHEIVPIQSCMLLDRRLDYALFDQKKILSALKPTIRQIFLVSGSDGAVASSPTIPEYSRKSTTIEVDKFIFHVDGDSFFQANKFLHHQLGQWASLFIEGKYAIDLYGGVGFFAIMLGDCFERGLLVDSDQALVAKAEKNLKANGFSRWSARHSVAERFFNESIDDCEDVDCLIVDPPRAGLSDTVRQGIFKFKPLKILYISCNPSTQARDAGFLVKRCGYQLTHAAVFDCYPQTSHIETGLLFAL
jgi:23S rRNA (uracil1939-C5)-methyltransferase